MTRARKASGFGSPPPVPENNPEAALAELGISDQEKGALSAYEARAGYAGPAVSARMPSALRRGLEEKRRAREAVQSAESRHVKRVTLVIPVALHTRLRGIADEMHLPLRDVLMQALELYGTGDAS